MMNLGQIISLIKGGKNPEQMVMSILGNNLSPVEQKLVRMARNNDVKGLETFATNLYKQKGMDFNKEVNNIFNLK